VLKRARSAPEEAALLLAACFRHADIGYLGSRAGACLVSRMCGLEPNARAGCHYASGMRIVSRNTMHP
jgi:poly(A) polymerase Pap1